MNREEFSRKWGWKYKGQVMFNMQAELLADLDSLSLPPAEGAEAILKEGLDDGRYADITDGINIDVKQPFYQAIIRYAEDVVAAQQQPTAEGAEEILDKYPHSIEYPSFVHENSAIAAMTEFATLHAQRIAEKMVSERLAPDEDVEVAIQDALYATGRFTTDECTILAEGILMYIKDHKIINLKTREK